MGFCMSKPEADTKAPARPSGSGSAASAAKKPAATGAQAKGSLSAKYTVGEKLGEGAFGTAHLATDKSTGERLAVKSINKRKLMNDEEVEAVRQEIDIMSHLAPHHNIVELKEAYEEKAEFHLVMELCDGGELFDRIIDKHHYSEKDAASLVRTMLKAIAHMHDKQVAHRDLKPENFLFKTRAEDSDLKITDFGLSSYFQPGEKFPDVCGTAYYVAPEVLRGKGEAKSDVWSVGVIAYILLSGEPPFNGASDRDIFQVIYRNTDEKFARKFNSPPWPDMSASSKDAIVRMCRTSVAARPSAKEMLDHPWVKGDTAPDTLIKREVINHMAQFKKMNHLKKVAMLAIGKQMSKDEVAELERIFKQMDTDNSGTITVEEMRQGMAQMNDDSSPLGTDAAAVVQAMQAMDVDGSGEIDWKEFLAAAINVRKVDQEENLMAAFSHFDVDKDGKISAEEISAALKDAGESVDVAQISAMLSEADTDNSGSIDYHEFVALMRGESEASINARGPRPAIVVHIEGDDGERIAIARRETLLM